MSIDLPPGARSHFDGIADRLVNSIQLMPAAYSSRADAFAGVPYYVERLRAQDIKTFELIAIGDRLGNEHEVYFSIPTGWVGFGAEQYPAYRSLVDSLASRTELRNVISLRWLMRTTIAWLKGRHICSIPAGHSYTRFLTDEATAAIHACEVAVPLRGLRIAETIDVAGASFRPFTSDFFDKLANAAPVEIGLERDRALAWVEKMRREHQGHVYGFVECECEVTKAEELAVEAVEVALIALRLFSWAAISPEAACYIGLHGRTLIPGRSAFVTSDGASYYADRQDDPRDTIFEIRPGDIGVYGREGLWDVGALLAKRGRTQYEDTCYSALRMLDKSIVSPRIDDKLVFALAAAEVLLLRDTHEPIQGLLSLRLAYLCSERSEVRRAVVDHLKRGYTMRSQYLHHGASKHELEVVRELLNEIRVALIQAVRLRTRFKAKVELLDALEEKMLAG